MCTMTTHTKNERRSDCPISVALDIIGDRWTLLIVRDLLFKDRDEFGAFLQSEERIATNVLADRLRKLEAHGIVSKVPHASDARKSQYRLTDRGLDLAPILVDLIVWAARYEKTAAPPKVLKRMLEDREAFIAETVHAAKKRATHE